ERGRVHAAAVLGDAGARALDHRLARVRARGDADDGDREHAAPGHGVERGEDLLVGEVAGDAEEHQRVGAYDAHDVPVGDFSACPPNWRRSAESRRSWNSLSPREAKRPNSDAASTCTGTPRSLAAASAQRPSPESETRPVKPASARSSANAAAVRSRSQDGMTLPRRQSSAISATSKS